MKDNSFDDCSNNIEDSRRIVLSIGDPNEVETRSVAHDTERTINDAYLLIFRADGKYVAGEKINTSTAITDNGEPKPTITPTLTPESGQKIVVLVNTGIDGLSSLTKVADATESNPASTIDDVNVAFPSGDVSGTSPNWKYSFSGNKMPMSGTMKVGDSECTMYRSVAKVNVMFKSDYVDATNKIANANVWFQVCNKPNQGLLYSNQGVANIPTSGLTFLGRDESWIDLPVQPATGEPLLSAYLPEYNASVKAKGNAVDEHTWRTDRLCVLVRVDIDKDIQKARYYRLDIATGNEVGKIKTFLDIKRNYHYKVIISKINSEGYLTADEAMTNLPSNMEYEIVADGDKDNVVESNGQYAVVLEYDKLVAYTDVLGETSLKVKAVMSEGVTSLPTTNSITASTGITLTGATTLTTAEQDLKFTMSAASGTITVKLGNITREILIEKKSPVDAHYNHITIAGNYSSLAPKVGDLSATINGTTSVTVHTGENVTPTNKETIARDPKAEPIFETKYNEGYIVSLVGRTKVIIEQKAPDYIGWFGGEPNQTGDTYYSKRLLVEVIEEGSWDNEVKDYTGTLRMEWYTIGGPNDENDSERGKTNTQNIVSSAATPTDYLAAYACWIKNDADGDGNVTATEYVVAGWYLPAESQLMAAWIVYPNFNTPWSGYYYWSSTVGSGYLWGARMVNFSVGSDDTTGSGYPFYVRCVRDL